MDILTVRVPVRFWESRRPAFAAPASDPTPLALDAARAAEGAELGDCTICGLVYHSDCSMCVGTGRAA